MRMKLSETDWARVLKKPRTLRPVWLCLGLGMVATFVQAWTQAAFFPR
ncbi:MAG: hypothetical protein HRU70_14790 [Phycisphaeraceae bacterium]|nr:MAG: hypothetical protein HRU70_14790 [Phycisphaeraceae bacterium]